MSNAKTIQDINQFACQFFSGISFNILHPYIQGSGLKLVVKPEDIFFHFLLIVKSGDQACIRLIQYFGSIPIHRSQA